ncbi:MAG TPA: GNAT family protein [Gemmatimonadaceae bacterium]|nr:GNAT family protein [Gemmatimonadaceae bacterium]
MHRVVPPLRTARLDLVAATPTLLRAELSGADTLAAALGARLPAQWPPDLFEADDMARVLAALEAPDAEPGWQLRYLVERDAPGGACLVGVAGFGGPPSPEGTVLLGYSVVPEARGRGLATEATHALVAFAFTDPRTRRVAAETFPELAASIRVLEKAGFARADGAETPGAVRFVRERPRGG